MAVSEAESSFELRTHASMRALGQGTYESVLAAERPPFLSFAWLDALERTGCVGEDRGWLPQHISLHEHGECVAVAPAYVKTNSEGEFVFDYAWARHSETALRTPYYPKLLLAVPFTPATGPRILMRPDVDQKRVLQAFARGIPQLCGALPASGAHVLFLPEADSAALEQLGYAERRGVQFHWENPGYQSFDDFLSRMNSKRRNQLRRERREMRDRNVEIRALSGRDLTPELIDFVFDFYLSTVEKFAWGRQYLCRELFEEIAKTMPDELHVVVARQQGRLVGGAFNFLGKDALYGRYWGATQEVPFLHFNVCFYFGIEECIRRGLRKFEPGAGGEHKIARGFEPTVTFSSHLLRHPQLDRAVREFLKRESEAVGLHVAQARRESVLKPLATLGPTAAPSSR
ncbi:MAG TPA: GNAT family N-acetyltransferase [Polyangiaceae bacterium]|nr:GNAT family N-acetyltransferase [Polyangiaceae bacterium]